LEARSDVAAVESNARVTPELGRKARKPRKGRVLKFGAWFAIDAEFGLGRISIHGKCTPRRDNRCTGGWLVSRGILRMGHIFACALASEAQLL